VAVAVAPHIVSYQLFHHQGAGGDGHGRGAAARGGGGRSRGSGGDGEGEGEGADGGAVGGLEGHGQLQRRGGLHRGERREVRERENGERREAVGKRWGRA